MLEVIRYLPLCIILVSSSNIKASKSHEDCDYGDCGQPGYFASGSAYSSQVLMPDGTVVTNSKGSSISSDGVQKNFQELKQEADKYVLNTEPKIFISRNEYTDRLPIHQVPQTQSVTVMPFMGPTSQSESRGLVQQFAEEHKQLPNANVNANPYIYQQFRPSVQDGYQNNLQHESENNRISSNMNPSTNSNQQAFLYDRTISLDGQQEYLDPIVETDNKLSSSSADGRESISDFQKKIRPYLRQLHDAYANIPVYFLSPKAGTFTANGINEASKIDEMRQFIPELIPTNSQADIEETHYTKDVSFKEKQSEQPFNPYVTPTPSKISSHVKITGDKMKKPKLEQNSQYIGAPDRSSRIAGGATGNEGRRAKVEIRAQTPPKSISTSQIFRRETHSQSIESNTQPISVEMNSGTQVQSGSAPVTSDVPQNDAAAPEPNNYVYVPLYPTLHQKYTQGSGSSDQAMSATTNGYGLEESTIHLNFPILLRGEPQNIRSVYPMVDSKNFANNPIDELTKATNLNSDKVNDSTSNSLVGDNGNTVPQNVDKNSNPSSNLDYFLTNGNVGEQLVPNSDIYVPSDAIIQHNPVLQFSNNNANLISEKCLTCIPNTLASLDTPQKSS